MKKLYKDFLGRDASSFYEIDIADFKELAELGKVHAIEYTARKHGEKKQSIYRHSFKKKPVMLTNGKELIIYGIFKITERGIEG